MLRTFFISAALLGVNAANAAEQQCTIENKYVCDINGCKQIDAKVWNLVDASRRTYARCDSAGCDTYNAIYSHSGAFLNIEVPGHSLIAKMAKDGASFSEVATLGHQIYISFGSCK